MGWRGRPKSSYRPHFGSFSLTHGHHALVLFLKRAHVNQHRNSSHTNTTLHNPTHRGGATTTADHAPSSLPRKSPSSAANATPNITTAPVKTGFAGQGGGAGFARQMSKGGGGPPSNKVGMGMGMGTAAQDKKAAWCVFSNPPPPCPLIEYQEKERTGRRVGREAERKGEEEKRSEYSKPVQGSWNRSI